MRLNKSFLLIAAVWSVLFSIAAVLLYLTNITVERQKITAAQDAKAYDINEHGNGFMMGSSRQLQTYTYEVSVRRRYFAPEKIAINAESCIARLAVSGVRIRYNNCPWGGVAYVRGTLLQKDGYDFRVTVHTMRYDMTGVTITADSPLRTFAQVLAAILVVAALVGLFYLAGTPKRIMVVGISGLLLSLVYLHYTPYDQRSYDIMGHIGYIRYLAHHYKLPAVMEGWESYQPPLYYIPAAVIYKLASVTGVTNPFTALQFFSFALYGVFLLFVYKILSFSGILRGKFLSFAFALFVFWPTSVIHSVMIGNDIMLYLWYAVSLYFTLKCASGGSRKDFIIAGASAALAVFTKSNGLLMVVLLFAGVALGQGRGWYRKHWKSAVLVAAAVLLLFGANASRLLVQPKKADIFIANVDGLGSKFAVKNTLSHMLAFDLRAYFTDPYGDVFDDRSGRQFFFPYLWKTALMNTQYFNMLYSEASRLLLLLFLYLAFFALAGFLASVRRRKGRIDPAIVVIAANAALLLSASFLARLKYPYSSTGDFRYIYPFLISFVFFLGYYLQSAGEKKSVLSPVAQILIIAFISLSAFLCSVPLY